MLCSPREKELLKDALHPSLDLNPSLESRFSYLYDLPPVRILFALYLTISSSWSYRCSRSVVIRDYLSTPIQIGVRDHDPINHERLVNCCAFAPTQYLFVSHHPLLVALSLSLFLPLQPCIDKDGRPSNLPHHQGTQGIPGPSRHKPVRMSHSLCF